MITFCLGVIVGGLIGVGSMAALIHNDKTRTDEYLMRDNYDDEEGY